MMTDKQSVESCMNGAAIILSDGREIPITDAMVRSSLEQLATDDENDAPLARVANGGR